jgi:aromatic-L-amino-acid/L-tryptophan decarboxylase
LLPEVRESIKGVEYADTICINFAKMMMVCNSGSFLFVRDKKLIAESTGNLSYDILKNEFSDQVVDYKDWTVGFGRRFNALKVYYMMR